MNQLFSVGRGQLPPEGVRVLARTHQAFYSDPAEAFRFEWNVVTLVKGISAAERASMADDSPRKCLYTFADQHGNNRRPYAWKGAGAFIYYGDEVDLWCYPPDQAQVDLALG